MTQDSTHPATAISTDIEHVIRSTQRLEELLKSELHGTGRGLGELARSLESILPQSVVENIVWIAGVRNHIAHKADATLRSRERFDNRVKTAEADLNTIIRMRQPLSSTTLPITTTSAGSALHLHRCWLTIEPECLKIHYQFKAVGLNGESCFALVRFENSNRKGPHPIARRAEFMFANGRLKGSGEFRPESECQFVEDFNVSVPHEVVRETGHEFLIVIPFMRFRQNGRNMSSYTDPQTIWSIRYESGIPALLSSFHDWLEKTSDKS